MNTFNSCHLWSISVSRLFITLICLLWVGDLMSQAATHYVVTNGTPGVNSTDPYTNWATAGTNIIDVVNAAMTNTPDRLVWVSNGVHVLTNQIVITNALTMQSIAGHGPDDTIINGNYTAGNPETNRCLFMSNASAFVSGFAFSNGACIGGVTRSGGGGVRMYSGILSNCTVRNNTVFINASVSYAGGGGVYIYPAGTAVACRVTDNMVTNIGAFNVYGGGIEVEGGAILDCLISNNVTYGSYKSGCGVWSSGSRISSSMICANRNAEEAINLIESSTMANCTVTVNQARGGTFAGGMITNCVISYNTERGLYMSPGFVTYVCRVFNTTITGNTNSGVRMNTAPNGGINQMFNCVITSNLSYGVEMYGTPNNYLSNCVVRGNTGGILWTNGMIRNCLIANNTNNGNVGGLLIGGGCGTVLVSCCTIVGNMGTNSGSGIRIEAQNAGLLSISSCIIYSNGVAGIDDVYDACAPANYNALKYSCIGSNRGFTGAGIIVTNPQFVDFAGGNYHLKGNSPCVNTGSNETWMTNAFDLDGRTRIRYGAVDMGAYETIYDGTIYKLW